MQVHGHIAEIDEEVILRANYLKSLANVSLLPQMYIYCRCCICNKQFTLIAVKCNSINVLASAILPTRRTEAKEEECDRGLRFVIHTTCVSGQGRGV